MISAQIYSLRAHYACGVVWRWRANTSKGKQTSSLAFVAYEDCAADAKKNGYTFTDPRVASGG